MMTLNMMRKTVIRNAGKAAAFLMALATGASLVGMPVSAAHTTHVIRPSEYTNIGYTVNVSASVTDEQKANLLKTFDYLPAEVTNTLVADNFQIYAWPSAEDLVVAGQEGIRGVYTTLGSGNCIALLSDAYAYADNYPVYHTLIHEIGHAVSDHDGKHQASQIQFYEAKTAEFDAIRAAEQSNLDAIDPIGKRSYANRTTSAEYFAEAFAMMCMYPEETQKACPQTVAYIQKVIARYAADADTTASTTQTPTAQAPTTQTSAAQASTTPASTPNTSTGSKRSFKETVELYKQILAREKAREAAAK